MISVVSPCTHGNSWTLGNGWHERSNVIHWSKLSLTWYTDLRSVWPCICFLGQSDNTARNYQLSLAYTSKGQTFFKSIPPSKINYSRRHSILKNVRTWTQVSHNKLIETVDFFGVWFIIYWESQENIVMRKWHHVACSFLILTYLCFRDVLCQTDVPICPLHYSHPLQLLWWARVHSYTACSQDPAEEHQKD